MTSLQTKTKEFKDFYESSVWKFHPTANIYERIRLQNLSEFLAPKSTDILLDAGCGGGTYTKHLAKVSTVIATDISKTALQNAKRELSELYKQIRYIICDNECLPLKDNSVDKIACIDVIEHIVNVKASLREMARVSKSHGRISMFTACGRNKFTLEHILEPVLGKFINLIRSKSGHVHIFSTQNLCRLLQPDFVVVKIQYMHHWLGWFVKFLWDLSYLSLPESCSRLPASKNPILSMFSRVLWLMLEAEYKLLKGASSGSEICVNAYTKETMPNG
jgi:ubiquinone/menaquinone biosynthesis C-methylase UbiE